MLYFTTSIAVVAGLCLAISVLYLFVGVRRPSHRTLNILFSLFALFYAGAIMTARSSYLANDFDQFVTANRFSVVFSAAGFAAFLWFVAAYTRVRPKVFLWAITAALGFYGLSGIFAPDLVVNTTQGVETLTFPWGEAVLMLQTAEPGLLPLLILSMIAMIGYVVVADVQQFRRGERDAAVALAIGIGWFAFTIIE
ncbi:MAG: hypothetical protein MUQ27_08280, partial [Acidimicrobiia bacterium]|nr:hypothetical protein [Acidimicrobiia bacterium]